MADRPTDSALSSMIQTMSSSPRQGGAPRTAPQIPMALAVPVVLLVAGLGAWLVYRYAFKGVTTPVADVVVLDGSTPFGMRGEYGSVSRQRGAINVRGMDYQLRATRGGNNTYGVTFDYPPEIRRSWVTPEQWELHQIAQRAASVPKFARHVNLSDEQRRQLQALPVNVQLTEAEVQRLRPFLSDWDRATDPEVQRSAQGPLLDAAQAISAAHRTDAKSAQFRRVQEISKILTAEQRQLADTYILPAGATPPPPAAEAASATPPTSSP
jgi:hypothetical protein